MRIGFVGLGNLGRAIVERLIDCELDLIVWNRTKGRANDLECTTASSLPDLAAKSDIIAVCLFDSEAVEQVLFGEESLSATDLSKKLLIDFTSHHFESVEKIHNRCSRLGISYLEAPIFGSVVPAKRGELTIVTSGLEAVHEQALTVLQKLATHIFHLPKPGMATRMKLVNNLVLGVFMAGIAEAVALGEAAGLNRTEILDILEVGGGKSGLLAAKKKKLLEDDFLPHFSCAAIQKDISNAEALAAISTIPIDTGLTANRLFSEMIKSGEGDLDLSAIFRYLCK